MVTTLIIIALVIICIMIIVNFNKIIEKKNKIKDKIIFPQKSKIFFKIFLIIVLILITIIIFIYVIKELISGIQSTNTIYEQNKQILEVYETEAEEFKIYSNILSAYKNSNSKEFYIPEGFSYVEGTLDTGFVIEDNQGNQFVWVPCNSENLLKSNFSDDFLASYMNCWESNNYEQFLKSALENGGFYVSRYETGIENGNIVSKYGVETLVNVTQEEIEEKINKTFNNDNINIEIINGYSYDRMLSWIMEENDDIENVDLEIYENDIILTGRKSYNNIYDVFDDMFEITSENYFINCLVYRGVSDTSTNKDIVNRYIAEKDGIYAFYNITSRLVLYK